MASAITIDEYEKLKKDLEEKNRWFDVMTELLPGGLGVYEYSNGIKPIYTTDGISRLRIRHDGEKDNEEGSEVGQYILDEDYAMLEKEISEARRFNRNVDCYIRVKKKDEELRWLWVRGSLIGEENGGALFYTLLIDVTRAKRNERELLIQAERYRILEETAEEILFEYKMANDTFTYSLKDFSGKLQKKTIPEYFHHLDVEGLIHPDYMEELRARLDDALAQQTMGEFEYLSSISNRGYEWHRMKYVSVTNELGNVSSIIGRIKNIHDEVLTRQIQNTHRNLDGMTNLYSKGLARTKIITCMETVDASDMQIMVLVGIDHFNRIVEQNGHSCGDAVIQEVSRLLTDILPDKSILGRNGNEKFLAYISDWNSQEIDEAVDRFLTCLSDEKHHVAGVRIECSIGVATHVGPTDYDALYEEVDEALYLARITKDTHFVRV